MVNLTTALNVVVVPDEDERLAAEGRHLLDGLVQHQLRLVEVEVAAHVVVVLPLLPTSLKIVI